MTTTTKARPMTDRQWNDLFVQARVTAGLSGNYPIPTEYPRFVRTGKRLMQDGTPRERLIVAILDEMQAVDEWERLHRHCPQCD